MVSTLYLPGAYHLVEKEKRANGVSITTISV